MRPGIDQLHWELNTNLENGYDGEDRKRLIQNEVRWRKIANEASETKQTKAREELDPRCSSGVTTHVSLYIFTIFWTKMVICFSVFYIELYIICTVQTVKCFELYTYIYIICHHRVLWLHYTKTKVCHGQTFIWWIYVDTHGYAHITIHA